METTSTKYCHYLRVSTAAQGIDGYGIDAQRSALAMYTPAVEFVEQESGKRKDRPELLKALDYCKRNNATLIVGKLDRLARSVAFVSALMESKVTFMAADFPSADTVMVHIRAVFAEYEAKQISLRTKAALAEIKKKLANGEMVLPSGAKTLGGTMDDTRRATATANRSATADANAAKVAANIRRARDAGSTLQAIADELNGMPVFTPRGSQWTPSAVRRALLR